MEISDAQASTCAAGIQGLRALHGARPQNEIFFSPSVLAFTGLPFEEHRNAMMS